MHRKKILTTALVASTIAGIGVVPAQNAEAASLSSFVSNALAIANDNSHGYSMVNRWGPDYDCSSFVITCLKQAGFETGGATYSGNMVSNLTQHGFSYIPSSKIDLSSSSSLQAGDILMASGHTEIYIGNGKRVGAHRNYDGKTGDSGGNEISVLNYSRGSWYGILRYTGSGSTATAVTTAATTTSSGQTGAYKINANLNLRSGNSTSTSILTTIPKGTSVTVSQVSNGWGKTTYSGKTGWIYLSYATYNGNTASTAAASKPAATTTAAATAAGTIYKTTANLNVRSGNSTSTSILTSIPKGTSVTVTEVKSNWGKTSYGGKTGWISLDYATKTGSTAAAASKPAATTTAATAVAGTVYKTYGNMYLRAGNNKSSAVLGVVPAGTSVTATQISNNWGKITYGGKTGWMSLKYSTKTGTVAAPKATTAKAATATKTATTASATASSTTSKTTSFIYQTTSNLNLRSGNSTSYSKLSVVPRGTAVTVTEVKNNWGKISYGGKTGWISLDYASKKGTNVVTTINTVVKNVASSSSKTVTYSYTTTANLNLRKSYSTSSAKILTMPNGTSLTVTEIKNNWGKVNYKGNVGWMSLQYAICTGSQTTIKNIIGQTSSTPTLKTASVPATTSAAKTASVAASASAVKMTTSAAPAATVAAKPAASVSLASAAPVSEAKADQDTVKAEETKPVSFSMPVSVVNAVEDEEKTVEAAEAVKETKTEEVAAEETMADDTAVEETAVQEEKEETVEAEAVEETVEEEAAEAEAVEETAEEEAAEAEAVEETVEEEAAEAEAVEETVEEEAAEAEAVEETAEEEAAEVEAVEEAEEEADEAESQDVEAEDAFAAGNYAAQNEIRVYADAYDGAEVLTTFEAGIVFEVTAENDGWGKVSIDGQTCWIRLADVEKTDSAATQGLTLLADTQDAEAASEDQAE